MARLTLGIPAVTGNLKYPTHSFDAEFSLMFFDKDILLLRRFAKYVAVFGEWPVPLPALRVTV